MLMSPWTDSEKVSNRLVTRTVPGGTKEDASLASTSACCSSFLSNSGAAAIAPARARPRLPGSACGQKFLGSEKNQAHRAVLTHPVRGDAGKSTDSSSEKDSCVLPDACLASCSSRRTKAT